MRHTSFSMEVVEESFSNIPNFNESAFCEFSKYGDLISNIFVKIVIPSVQISTAPDTTFLVNTNDNTTLINTNKDYINSFKIFIESAMYYWIIINNNLNDATTNFTVISEIINTLTSNNDFNLVNYNNNINIINDINNIDNNIISFNFDIIGWFNNNQSIFSNSGYDSNLNLEFKKTLKQYLDNYIFYSNKLYKLLIDYQTKLLVIKQTNTPSYYRFGWVEKLGFAIINNIAILIGGQEIDSFTNDNLNIWYELINTKNKDATLNNMIGNVEILTNFDTEIKPTYNLIIPLPFWFCKYKSQALPCIAIKYDITLNIKLSELFECCYFEPTIYNLYTSNINLNENITISNISLLVEYIFLGSDERNKFGNYKHEYLIEQNNRVHHNNKISTTLLDLDFFNPTKEIIWVIQSKNAIKNFNLWNKYEVINIYYGCILDSSFNITLTIYDNYNRIIKSGSIINYQNYMNGYIEIINSKYYNGFYNIKSLTMYNIMIDSKILFIFPDTFIFKLYPDIYKTDIPFVMNENIQIYGRDLQSVRDKLYFTLVQNFQHHSNIPINIHTFSFALNSEQFQPSGSCNFSCINSKNLYLEFDKNIIDIINNNNDEIIIKIFSISYNILLIEKGSAKTIFSL